MSPKRSAKPTAKAAPAASAGIGAGLERQFEQAFNAAIVEDRKADRDTGADGEPIYPRPLRAGAQSYVDPKVWNNGQPSDYKSLVESIVKLDELRSKPD